MIGFKFDYIVCVIGLRPVEMKKILGGATNYEILSAATVGQQRKFFISNRVKRLEKFDICRRQVM